MTRKDYQLIAGVFHSLKEKAEAEGFTYSPSPMTSVLVATMARALQEDNPRFNAETFKKACGF